MFQAVAICGLFLLYITLKHHPKSGRHPPAPAKAPTLPKAPSSVGEVKKGKDVSNEKPTTKELYLKELAKFESYYEVIIKALEKVNDDLVPDMKFATEWMRKLMDYNVTGGKRLRGIMIPTGYRKLAKNATKEDMDLAYILGWIVEMLQATSLIADDMMDNSETRRGKPCWYKLEEVGLMAINDTLLLYTLCYKLLRFFFADKPYYLRLEATVQDIINGLIYGQALDYHTGKSHNIIETFDHSLYSQIVKYKTSYFTVYFPVALSLVMAEMDGDKEAMKLIEKIALEIGYYFQVQDDVLDCFGDPKVTGKIGTDIEENKCTWLFLKAKEVCSPEQIKLLAENYGSEDPLKVERVKNLYKELKLKEIYEDFESKSKENLKRMINELGMEEVSSVLLQLLHTLSSRQK